MTSFLISDVMVKSPVCVEANASIETAHDLMQKNNFQHIPVLKKGEAVGVVSIRDIEMVKSLYGKLGSRGSLRVEDIDNRTEAFLVVEPTATLKSVAEKMAANKVTSALIVQNGKVEGIFTATDAYKWIAANA